jgi:peroxiredoxin
MKTNSIIVLFGVAFCFSLPAFAQPKVTDPKMPSGAAIELLPEQCTEFNGEKAAEFGLLARDGTLLDVRKFRGRPIIIEFFTSWSQACREQLRQLIEFNLEYADEGLAIFAFAVDRFEAPERASDVQGLIWTMGIRFPVGAATREMANDYHYKGVPATVLLDCEGRIARIFFGFHDTQEFKPVIKALLATKK